MLGEEGRKDGVCLFVELFPLSLDRRKHVHAAAGSGRSAKGKGIAAAV